jgi:hypothetical protein
MAGENNPSPLADRYGKSKTQPKDCPERPYMAAWLSEGTAAGNGGDIYINRDRGHSMLAVGDFPLLTSLRFPNDARRYEVDLDLPNMVFKNSPFVFGNAKEKDSKIMYASGMKYFIIFTLLAFLAVMGYLDILKYLLRNRDYWEGLKVVPIVMVAEIMMGVYFNLSFWYKLIDKTIWGAIFSGAGCAVLLAVNFIFVPKMSYMACAWAGVAGYGTAMLLSYFVGQKYYKIDYPMKDIALYTALAAVLYVGIFFVSKSGLPIWARLGINTVIILVYMAYIVKKDLPLSGLPVVGKYFRKR